MGRLLARWRASLQLRVVVLTTMLGLAVVVGVGSFLLDGIADGLVAERQKVALADAARSAQTAQQQFDAATTTSSAEVEQLAGDVVSALEGRARTASAGSSCCARRVRPTPPRAVRSSSATSPPRA